MPSSAARTVSKGVSSVLQILFQNAHQAVIGTYIYVAIARRQRGHVTGWQAGGDRRPTLAATVISVEAAVERTRVDTMPSDEHGVRVHHKRVARCRETVPLSYPVQPLHAGAVRAGKPFVADPAERGDPVVLQPRIRSSVRSLYHAVLEYRETAERAGENGLPFGRDGVHVIVDQSLKRVQAAGSPGIDNGEPGGGGDQHAIVMELHVCHMIGN